MLYRLLESATQNSGATRGVCAGNALVHRERLDVEAVGGGDFGVPVARVFDGALLVTVVDVDESIALGVAVGPFEIVEKAPGVE
jgi:hypothetical protein